MNREDPKPLTQEELKAKAQRILDGLDTRGIPAFYEDRWIWSKKKKYFLEAPSMDHPISKEGWPRIVDRFYDPDWDLIISNRAMVVEYQKLQEDQERARKAKLAKAKEQEEEKAKLIKKRMDRLEEVRDLFRQFKRRKPTFKILPLDVTTADGPFRVDRSYQLKGLAIHRELKSPSVGSAWVVTHLASGLQVPGSQCWDITTARWMVWFLTKDMDWEAMTVEEIKARAGEVRDKVDLVKSSYTEFRGEAIKSL